MDTTKLLSLTTEIVSAHAAATGLTQDELLEEIGQVFVKLAALAGIEGTAYRVGEAAQLEERASPAVPLEAAFGANKVFCMVCGAGMKTLKRHLFAQHGLKPGAYRRLFGIPAGTPLVARDYSKARRALAEKLQLGDRLVEARASKARKALQKGKRGNVTHRSGSEVLNDFQSDPQ